MRTPGWYPDPTGRFEHRYHNGDSWTADVAVDGRRFVDHVGDPAPSVGGGTPTGGAPGARNGIATAGMVCGIVGVSLAWIPFLTVAGLVVAIVGLVLAGVGLRRSRPDGTGRAAALTGLITGALGVGVSALGIWLTVIVTRVLQDFDSPEPSAVNLTGCAGAGGRTVAEGELTNMGDDTQTYTVTVELRGSAARQRERIEIESVAPGERRTFTVEARVGEVEPSCEIVAVRGPLPFGFDPGID